MLRRRLNGEPRRHRDEAHINVIGRDRLCRDRAVHVLDERLTVGLAPWMAVALYTDRTPTANAAISP